LPERFRTAKEKDVRAFLPSRGWIGKVAAVRTAAVLSAVSTGAPLRTALSGTMRIPVIGGLYSDFSGQPQDLARLQTELFDGPWPTGTMSEYFSEASAGLFDVTGDVYGWINLDNTEIWYTWESNGLDYYSAHTDVFIEEVVSAVDDQVDFGIYDNDGPDGIPNSGDDDGYVDVLMLVHPTIGAECYSSIYHMWSHSGQYSLWDDVIGGPLETNDPAAGGGVILIDDYIMAPTVSCGSGLIEIGVFCHELGHAIGLPDLYDYNGGSYGIGYWGLMGSGNWNTPESPAHPCGWSKEQLGWVTVTDIGWRSVQRALPPVIQSDEVIRLVTPVRRFRLTTPQAAPMGQGLVCGYDTVEADYRGWPRGAGYGNLWNESMSRSFVFDGTLPVMLDYHIETDIEDDYDFAYMILMSPYGSAAETLAVYTGINAFSPVSIDLGAYLQDPVFDEGYVISFAFASDFNFSDEDGRYDSAPSRALLIDDIRVQGGGEDYFTDFEEDAGGWRDTSPPTEYFLVENRTRIGFDAHLPGEGLLIWHAESSTANSYLGNSGGTTNTQTRGLVLEEADGNYDLISPGGNPGDSGDPWQGSTANRNFASSTVPSSQDNSGNDTPVSVTGISNGSGLFAAGMPAPAVTSIDPTDIVKAAADTVYFEIRGSGILYGAQCSMTKAGQEVHSDSVYWLGENRIIARFGVNGLYAGEWDVIITSGDGQQSLLESGLTVRSAIVAADVETGLSYLMPVWLVSPIGGLIGSLVSRSEDGGPFVQLGDTLKSETGGFEYVDESVVSGIVYRYSVKVIYESVEEEFAFSGEYSIKEHGFHVIGNFPNPFSESTKIVFFTPDRRTVRIRFYDVSGRLVDDLGEVLYGRGTQEVIWDPEPGRIASGVYFCAVAAGHGSTTMKIVLIR
jgi:M6 family metalloprotease-like protein